MSKISHHSNYICQLGKNNWFFQYTKYIKLFLTGTTLHVWQSCETSAQICLILILINLIPLYLCFIMFSLFSCIPSG